MVHKTWKQTEEKELIEAFKKAGCRSEAIPQLAKRFNRSPDAIKQKLHRLGLLGLNVVGTKFSVTTTFERELSSSRKNRRNHRRRQVCEGT